MRGLAAALGLVLALATACRRPAPPPPLPAPNSTADAVETREVQLADDFITVRLHIPPTTERRKPTLISMVGGRPQLLRQGLLVATYRINWEFHKPPLPPAPPAAENTVGKWILASPSAAVIGREYLRSLTMIADEAIPRIVDYLMTVPEVDPARLAIAGSSSNGFVALQAIARDRRLAVAVALSACGDYHTFLRDSTIGMQGQPLALDPDYDRWLRRQEVVEHPRRVVHAALLMVNRTGDPIIPFSCAARTADVLGRAYERAGVAERFRFTAIDSDKHGLDDRDAEETLAWLGRWLRPKSAGPPHRRRRGPRP